MHSCLVFLAFKKIVLGGFFLKNKGFFFEKTSALGVGRILSPHMASKEGYTAPGAQNLMGRVPFRRLPHPPKNVVPPCTLIGQG